MNTTHIRRVTYRSGATKDTPIRLEDVERALERTTTESMRAFYGVGTVDHVEILRVTEEVLASAHLP